MTTPITKVIIPNNTDISIEYTSSDVYIKLSMSAGLKSWSDTTGILTRIFGDMLTKRIVVRVLNQMGTVITMDTNATVSTRVYINGKTSYIDIDVSKASVSINARGFQVKPMT